MRDPITPRGGDWLLVAVVAILILIGLDQLDQWGREQQQIIANDLNVARARIDAAIRAEGQP